MGVVFTRAIGARADDLPKSDWTEKSVGSDQGITAGVATLITSTSVLQIVDCGKWWTPFYFSCGILCGATPPTSVIFTAGYSTDFDQGNGIGGTDTDVKGVPLNLLVANGSFFFDTLFQLFGVCAHPPNGITLKVSVTAAGQNITLKHDMQLSAWSFQAAV